VPLRNPEIAKLIEESDTDVRHSFERLLGERTPETVSRCALVAALLDGLSVRSIRDPGVAGEIDRAMLAKVVRFILTAQLLLSNRRQDALSGTGT